MLRAPLLAIALLYLSGCASPRHNAIIRNTTPHIMVVEIDTDARGSSQQRRVTTAAPIAPHREMRLTSFRPVTVRISTEGGVPLGVRTRSSLTPTTVDITIDEAGQLRVLVANE